MYYMYLTVLSLKCSIESIWKQWADKVFMVNNRFNYCIVIKNTSLSNQQSKNTLIKYDIILFYFYRKY